MTIQSREDYRRQRIEHRSLENQLAQVEQAERGLLSRMRWPENIDAAVEQLQKGRGRKADRARVFAAIMALLYVRETRRHVGDDNPRRAAYAALLAGAWAGELALRGFAESGGRARGSKIAAAAARHDSEIEKMLRLWQISDELQDRYRSETSYIKSKKPHLSKRTIQRRLKHIKKPRQ